MANMFVLSETEPTSVGEGRSWYKPSIGQLFMYINNEWRPFAASGSPLTLHIGYTVFIRTEDKTHLIDGETFNIKDILTYQVDTCDFRMWDDGGDSRPEIGYEVQVFHKASSSADPELIYGGEIISMPQAQTGDGLYKYYYDISCADYGRKLKRTLVHSVYEAATTQAIIADICDTYATEFTYNNVQTGITVSYINFNYKSAWDCIKELAELNGMDFYVDQYKDIHLVSPTTNPAPYVIDDDTDVSGKYKELTITADKSQYRNTIIVQGGYYLSNDFEDIITVGDDTETAWNLKYTPYAAASGGVEAYISPVAGGGYAAVDLGIDNINDGTGDDLLINATEKLIKQGADYNASAGDLIKIIYKYKIPVITQDSDDDSIAAIQLKEGGNGIYEDIITDSTLETLEAAHVRAMAELTKYANPIISGSFKTSQTGYRSGQYVTINSSTRGYAGTYMIQSVDTYVIGGSTLEYQINFATKLKGLTELLGELYDSTKEVIIRNDETLHAGKYHNDTVTLAESVTNEYASAIVAIYTKTEAYSDIHSAMAIDSSGYVHVALRVLESSVYKLLYLTNATGSWVTSTVATYSDVNYFRPDTVMIDAGGFIHITGLYYDDGAGTSALYYYENYSNTPAWTEYSVVALYADTYTNAVMRIVSGDFYIYIAATKSDGKAYVYDYNVMAGWSQDNISATVSPNTDWIGIDVDSSGNLYVLKKTGNIVYVYENSLGWAGTDIETIVDGFFIGSIKVDDDDNVHISYYSGETPTNILSYGFYNGSWAITDLTSGTPSATNPLLIIDGDGYPKIYYTYVEQGTANVKIGCIEKIDTSRWSSVYSIRPSHDVQVSSLNAIQIYDNDYASMLLMPYGSADMSVYYIKQKTAKI